MVELELETIVVIIISTIIILYLLWNIIKMKLGHKAAIKDARKDTATRQRSTIKGDISEIIAPWSMNTVDSVKELKFLGNPIDFVGFKGLDGEGDIDIKFIEVKSGKSRLNKNQRRIRDAVDAKRIEWVEVRIKDSEIEIEEKVR
jgi:predicted Holliday junction resolvase-like endonuclease